MAEETTDGLIIVSSDSPEPAETPGAPAPPGAGRSRVTACKAPSDDDEAPEAVSPRELRRLVGRMTAQRTAMERELGATRAQVETLMKLIQPASQNPTPPTGPPRRPRQVSMPPKRRSTPLKRLPRKMVDYRLAEREARSVKARPHRASAERCRTHQSYPGAGSGDCEKHA